MSKIIFLGTNGWYDSETGNTPSVLIETEQYCLILDAGNGIYKLNKYISYDKPAYLFLSHFHLDHISGLHTLVKNKFSNGLYIIVQDGGKDFLERFISSPFTVPIKQLPFKVEILEVDKIQDTLPFKASFLPLKHSIEVLGVRLEINNKIITYCTDTAECQNAIALAKDADILITECSMAPNAKKDANVHLNPQMAAKLAKEAEAKNLYLMHFDASTYTNKEMRIEAELNAKETFANSFAAFDGLEVKF
ncbi:ribonuclease Z [Clostridium folliculivorans]|uniref:Sulfohydrolase/glycosulfatase n=1 Tax=Clostridium folliculivorans TaxID=2886038 RepID=A0A9W5Y143_9CLOT|nr:ribonuclease Z [Clostridium folliculivorans]GKU24668.1 sulfohydrolase/glycosulfatase [Clostridium folliculivorans]GKU30766.1 sulfohydrolase/glycosulfatase [Clostridium folliculivorans]